MRKKEKTFGDMLMSEIEKWEQETNSIVLFDDDKGIAFQKCKGEEPALAIIIDGRKQPIILMDKQVENLTTYLNKNF